MKKKIKDEKEEEKEKEEEGEERAFERRQGTSWHFSWSMRHERISQATSQMSVPEILALFSVQPSPVGLALPAAGPWTWLFPPTAALQQVVAANLSPSCLRGYLITWSSLFASARTCHPLPAPPLPPHSCLPICGLHRQLPRADHNHPASTPTDGYTSRLHLTCYLACELGCGDDLCTERKEMESDLEASEKTGNIISGGNWQSWSEMDFMGTPGISFSKCTLFEDRFCNFRPYFSYLFFDGVSLGSSGWTRIHYVEPADLELSGLCSPSAGIQEVYHHDWLTLFVCFALFLIFAPPYRACW